MLNHLSRWVRIVAYLLVGLHATFSARTVSGATISGTITEQDGSTPISGVLAWVYTSWDEFGWYGTGSDYTDSNGYYEISSLPAGTHRLQFIDQTGNFIGEHYDDTDEFDLATSLVLSSEEVRSNLNASLESATGVSGKVTGSDGITPLENIYVQAYRWNGNYWSYVTGGYTYTDDLGNYVLSGLPSGSYRIEFQDFIGNYVGETYDDYQGFYWNGGTTVVVPAAGVVTGINASLAEGAVVSGRVTASNGITGLANIQVSAYQWNGSYWNQVASASTDGAGEYEVKGLASGSYRIEFQDFSGYFVREIYDNFQGSVWDGGTIVVVPTAGVVTDINASLASGAVISGQVTASDGITGLANIQVSAYQWNGSYWDSVAWASTDGAGEYELKGLGAGTYRVDFRDYSESYIHESYNDYVGDVSDGGADIVVPEAGLVTDINASLTMASKISGTVTGPDGVTPLFDISATVYRFEGGAWNYVRNSWTDAGGNYEIGGLTEGTYRLRFSDYTYVYVGEVYSNAVNLEDGMDIVVPAATTVGGINASLALYATLSGVVMETDGLTPIAGVGVQVWDPVTDYAEYRTTAADGSYTVSQLAPGNYTVLAEPVRGSGWLPQWYSGILYVSGQPTPPAVTLVAITSGAAVAGINFSLDAAARLSGQLTGASTLILTDGVVRAEGQTLGQTYRNKVDATGHYELNGMLPDLYLVKAEAAKFQDEWWVDAHHRDQSSPVLLDYGDDLSLDFDLVPGQSPAFIEVTSDPSGAQVYLDHQPTTNLTPTVLEMGEIGSRDWNDDLLAPHVITVKKAGSPRPSPRSTGAKEAETIGMHFDLVGTASGFVSVETIPAGATVYVDYADQVDGITPVVVGNLAPGSHVILLKESQHLQARSVLAWIQDGATNHVVIPLTPNSATDRMVADVQSVPPGASILVDYLPTTNVTGAIVDWLDPASHTGLGWHSASHTILLKKDGFRPPAARYVVDRTNETQTIHVNLIGVVNAALDEDHDGLPDQLEDAYRLNELAPGQSGPDDDPDHDGVKTGDELRAGTNPLDPGSTFEVPGMQMVSSPEIGSSLRMTFDTVPGRTYLLQAAEQLPLWVNISSTFVATGEQTVIAVDNPGFNAQFYRLIVLAP
jgi:5-hydroxyisourate hydrolase-like protein (transthyretin family)